MQEKWNDEYLYRATFLLEDVKKDELQTPDDVS